MAHEIMELAGVIGEMADRPSTRANWPKPAGEAHPTGVKKRPDRGQRTIDEEEDEQASKPVAKRVMGKETKPQQVNPQKSRSQADQEKRNPCITVGKKSLRKKKGSLPAFAIEAAFWLSRLRQTSMSRA